MGAEYTLYFHQLRESCFSLRNIYIYTRIDVEENEGVASLARKACSRRFEIFFLYLFASRGAKSAQDKTFSRMRAHR